MSTKKNKDLAVITRELQYDLRLEITCVCENEQENLRQFLMSNRIKIQLENKESNTTAITLTSSEQFKKLKLFLDRQNAKRLIDRLNNSLMA